MKKHSFLIACIFIFIFFSISVFYFYHFTAEDAYIVYRYAENLINTGALVYNLGEPINALTSPLHTLISSALFFLTGETLLANKLLALCLLLISAFLVAIQFKEQRELKLLAFSLILLPPCIIMWTFGGLETPFLLFLATIVVLLIKGHVSSKKVYIIFFLAGLGFLTRYDSVLFFFPLVLYTALKSHTLKQTIIASMTGAFLPVLWMIVSIIYYGDILPTSFYVKTPTMGLKIALKNGLYILSYLFFVGIIPVVFYLYAILPRPKSRVFLDTIHQNVKKMWWLYLALFFELLYGLTMARTHMMFSFRYFTPYIPAAVLLVLELIYDTVQSHKITFHSGATSKVLFIGLLVSLWCFQIFQVIYTYNYSLNGISFLGQYRTVSVQKYFNFSNILRKHAEDIKTHWDSPKKDRNRLPRIYVYAGGILPYTFRKTYIYEKLISYRHNMPEWKQVKPNAKLSADYISMIAPKNGTPEHQLPLPLKNYTLISSYKSFFSSKGSEQSFLVYYNPNPRKHILPSTIKGLHNEALKQEMNGQ